MTEPDPPVSLADHIARQMAERAALAKAEASVNGNGRQPAQAGPGAPQVAPVPEWPVIAEEAFLGPIGEAVLTCCDPGRYSEADPAAVLMTSMAMFATLLGLGPYVRLGSVRSWLRLFVAVIGDSATGRKGASSAVAEHVIGGVTPTLAERTRKGFGSGEAVVDALDGDPRLLIREPEYAHLLRICGRAGDTTSSLLMDAWDADHLSAYSRQAHKSKAMTESAPAAVNLVVHGTPGNLAKYYSEETLEGGFASRVLLVACQQWGRVPIGESLPDLSEHWTALRRALSRVPGGEITLDAPARRRWELEWYDELSVCRPGPLKALDARGGAQVLRCAGILAVSRSQSTIGIAEVEAAMAEWRFCQESSALFLGEHAEAPGPQTPGGIDKRNYYRRVDKLLRAIRAAGLAGLTGKERHKVFGNHLPASEVEAMVAELERAGMVRRTTRKTSDGPDQQVVVATDFS